MQGTRTFLSGSKYVGDMQGGKRHGRGTKTWPNGDRYEGEWRNDKRDGWGKFCHAGDVYEGNWRSGVRHGAGTCTYRNGDRYEGAWEHGEANGQGAYFKANGNVFRGQYVNNKCEGFGVYVFQNGDSYSGDWVRSTKHGTGRIEWADGRSFEGRFHCDCPLSGTYVYEEGIFENEYDGSQTFSKGATALKSRQRGNAAEAEPLMRATKLAAEARRRDLEGVRGATGQDITGDAPERAGISPGTVGKGPRGDTLQGQGLEGSSGRGGTSEVVQGDLLGSASVEESNLWEAGNKESEGKSWEQLVQEAAGRGGGEGLRGQVVAREAEIDTLWCPKRLACPLCHELMLDPVQASDGAVYDRRAIQKWFSTNGWSPSTGRPLENLRIEAHQASAAAVREFCRQRDWEVPEGMLTVNQNETLGKEADHSMAKRLFEQEARVLQRVAGLNHCCQMLGACRLGDRNCLIMKLYKMSLQDALLARPRGAFEVHVGLRHSLEMLSGLQALHDAGVVYLDLKPSNLLFDQYDTLFLADFGISMMLPPGQDKFVPEVVNGTPNFMSPEQLRPAQSRGVGKAADIWSAACIVLEMVSGHAPFRGMQHGEIEAEVCDRRSHPHMPPSLGAGLADILGGCFRHDPLERPSAGALRAKLQAFQVKLPQTPSTMEAPQSVAPSSPMSFVPASKTGPFIAASAATSLPAAPPPSRRNKPPPLPPPQEAVLIDI